MYRVTITLLDSLLDVKHASIVHSDQQRLQAVQEGFIATQVSQDELREMSQVRQSIRDAWKK